MNDMSGKTVLITGAATGIGKAAALLFAENGATVLAVTDRNTDGLKGVVKEIEAKGGKADAIVCDVTDEKAVNDLMKWIPGRYSRLDIAFNNAGLGPDGVRIPYGPLTELKSETWDKVINVNLKGVFLCLKYELILMQKQGFGSIVNTASAGGLHMAPGFGADGPSKAGVIALTQLAALENAKTGIRVNAVCPGPTLGTELIANTFNSDANAEKNMKEKTIPMGKLGTAEEVARVVLWLCSDEAGHITGHALPVDGGMDAL